MELDYKKVGLRVGFEIHQELDTNKLFCNCPSQLRDDRPTFEVRRRLRPTQSELGEVDRTALAEATKEKGFKYQVYPDTVCLVELDEEPPHPVNEQALDITLEIALLLNAKPVDEVHTMRKTVIDGSNTCGFQRTMMVATDGRTEIDGKKFCLPTICLEEDAARKMGEESQLIDYRLDRLGIPLVEIATGPDFNDPVSPSQAAFYIGRVLRATGKVKRGIGTIRQDINVSIADGARQEIKGLQELGIVSAVIQREVQRQLALLEIRKTLRSRGAEKVARKIVDVTGMLARTNSRVLRKVLNSKGVLLALKLSKFGGLVGKELQSGRRLGTELADRAKIYGKTGGLFHTDELPNYGISQAEVNKLKERMDAGEDDAVILVADSRDKAETALWAVLDRANESIDGIPEETRRALPNGNTEFMRPLPGAGRMYPETDIPPIPVTPPLLKKIKRKLPELPEKRRDTMMKKYRLGRELAERISLSENLNLFEELIAKTGADPKLVATALEETMVSLRREGIMIERIEKSSLEELFKQVTSGGLAKEAIPDVLRLASQGLQIQDAMRKLGLSKIEFPELKKLVAEVVSANMKMIEERKENAIGPLMGIIMEKARGRADGKLVSELLEQEIKTRTSTK